jgi:hypothetical protein
MADRIKSNILQYLSHSAPITYITHSEQTRSLIIPKDRLLTSLHTILPQVSLNEGLGWEVSDIALNPSEANVLLQKVPGKFAFPNSRLNSQLLQHFHKSNLFDKGHLHKVYTASKDHSTEFANIFINAFVLSLLLALGFIAVRT